MRAYRALLRLYPSSFRAEYEKEMCAIFARRRRDAAGIGGLLALWAEASSDTLVNAARIHWDVLRQDLRYAAGTLRRSPGFTITAMLVGALGIGATTAAFSITDHVLLKPLPFRDAGRLVSLWHDESFRGSARVEVSPGNYRDWRDRSTSYEAMAAHHPLSANLVGQGEPARLEGTAATGGLFRILGVEAALGRTLVATDEDEGAPPVLVLSDRLWRSRFGGDPDVLGRTVILDEAPHVIVGVMPRGFEFPSRDVEFWTPIRFEPADFDDRDNTYLRVVARLGPGVTLDQARSGMRVIAAQLEREFPKENARTGVTVVHLRDQIRPQARLLLLALLGASVCVLLIACTNLASLLLTRSLARRREMAVRVALGAGRRRLVRQVLTESLVLAAIGGAIGVLLAIAAAPLVARLVPNTLPIAGTPGVDLRMLAFAALATCATGVGFGVVPALRACRGIDARALGEGSRTGSGPRTERLRSMLVVAEVAVSLVLLVSSGLLIRALWRVQDVDPGFRTEGVLTLRTTLPLPKYERTERRWQFYDRVLTDIRALPGVSGAAYVSFLPMVMPGGIWPITIGAQPEDPAESRMASLRYVTPGFFEAAGIPLRMGRDVSASDTRDVPFVAVVSESFARAHWPGRNPLGERFHVAFGERIVVGVAGDVRVRGLERSSEPQVYLPARQVPDGWIIGYTPRDLIVRSSVAPGTLVAAIRRIVSKADPHQPISDVRMLSDIVEAETTPRRVQLRVVGAFAGVAFLLAGIGIHGLLAFTVSSRAREIGVRVALGARPPDVVAMVLKSAALLAASGIVLGSAFAYAAGRSMQALLAGVSPGDAATFAGAVSLALVMAAAGSLVPAIRAVRVDPIVALRAE